MTPGARLAAAIDVLADLEARYRPVGLALRDWGTTHRFAGSKDRAAIGNIVYDALRWRASSAWAMGDETARALVLGTVGRRWGTGGTALATMIRDVPHAPEPLSDEEIERIDTTSFDDAPLHVQADVPEWLSDRFVRAFADDWVSEGEALALRPPLDLRVNPIRAGREKVMKALEKFSATETSFAPHGIRIPPTTADRRHPNVQVEPGFRKGWFEVQDEGSQLAALIVGAKPGEQILDLCAGAGGKTLALAAAMENKGQVLATDGDRTRLAPIFERLKRAGTRNVQVRPAGAALDDLAGRMDAVLVDAPCTGTGVWRRRPDSKWRLSEKALGDRTAEQSALLETAAQFVKPGGRLVYVTCSLLPDENDDRIAAFLASRGGFAPQAPLQRLEPELATRLTAAGRPTSHGVMLTPRSTATDGFFISVIGREGS